MAQVRFPSVSATCQVPGAPLGVQGTVTAQIRATAERVAVRDMTTGRGTATLDGNGNGRWGLLSRRLSAGELRRVASGVRSCANGLQAAQATGLRQLAQRLDELAASRPQRR